jgi:hypothetical protein
MAHSKLSNVCVAPAKRTSKDLSYSLPQTSHVAISLLSSLAVALPGVEGEKRQRPAVLVDARNVQRSRWPNVPDMELVERIRGWARREGLQATIVFDGRAPVDEADVVGTGADSADDWIARRAAELRAAPWPYWLVTSDRGLRARAAEGADGVVGGGSFLRELGLA